MVNISVPEWWFWASFIFFILFLAWNILLGIAGWQLYKKIMPLIKETQVQVRRVSGQAKSIAAKASNTAEIVHAQTQNLLGNAQSAGSLVTKQARMIGAALTGLLVAARVINFVRKVI
ncbi:MAG TPA: hypothetical protein VFA07_15835 [Chthonomonadaceae bacterium]|nr:hypothetical protein [Chthonomonadaceae bacterium]